MQKVPDRMKISILFYLSLLFVSIFSTILTLLVLFVNTFSPSNDDPSHLISTDFTASQREKRKGKKSGYNEDLSLVGRS